MPDLDLVAYLVILLAFALGGILKGATGAGAPVVAVPVMAAVFDPRLAVVIMVVPNLVSNLTQLRIYWPRRLPQGFALRFALAGSLGALIGSYLLAVVPVRGLTLGVALVVVCYIVLRIARPDLRLKMPLARRLLWPAGIGAGLLQGSAGISAPISVSFLNAMQLERPVFIATISVFFAAMSLVQVPALLALGLLTPQLAGLSAVALVPLLAAMPLGAWLARRMSARAFDRLILAFLIVLALRLLKTGLM